MLEQRRVRRAFDFSMSTMFIYNSYRSCETCGIVHFLFLLSHHMGLRLHVLSFRHDILNRFNEVSKAMQKSDVLMLTVDDVLMTFKSDV